SRGDLVVSSRFRDRRVPDSKPEATKEPPCMLAWCTLNLMFVGQMSPAGVVRKFGEASAGSCVVLIILPRFKIARSVPK
ncbi:hypothetical protein AVEN_67078-1, partial [Araneus ventricosus]